MRDSEQPRETVRGTQQLHGTGRDSGRQRETCSNSIALREIVRDIQQQRVTVRGMKQLHRTGIDSESQPATIEDSERKPATPLDWKGQCVRASNNGRQ